MKGMLTSVLGCISQFAFETSLYEGLMPAFDGSRKLPMCQRGPTGCKAKYNDKGSVILLCFFLPLFHFLFLFALFVLPLRYITKEQSKRRKQTKGQKSKTKRESMRSLSFFSFILVFWFFMVVHF